MALPLNFVLPFWYGCNLPTSTTPVAHQARVLRDLFWGLGLTLTTGRQTAARGPAAENSKTKTTPTPPDPKKKRDPHAHCAQAGAEGENVAQGKSDEPITDSREQQRHA